MDLRTIYSKHKQEDLFGRYIPPEKIEPLLLHYKSKFEIEVIGTSEEGKKIHSIKLGSGDFKIFMWSQMHGNESTTTKALFDFINYLKSDTEEAKIILDKFSIKIIPMLNPDGAERYTRENANKIDLNRDAQNRSQLEIRALFKVFDDFKPNLCLNLHDQRSIFSAGKKNKSAIISFLSPSADENKTITPARQLSMQLIANMAIKLDKQIREHIGRYDDEFNLNCVGDTFQSMEVPTILIEAGHFPEDYQRENTREYIFHSLLYLFNSINLTKDSLPEVSAYFSIPENKKLFYDILIKNVKISNKIESLDVVIQYEEQLVNKKIVFIPKIVRIEDLNGFYGHKTFDALGEKIQINNDESLKIGMRVNELLIGEKKISF